MGITQIVKVIVDFCFPGQEPCPLYPQCSLAACIAVVLKRRRELLIFLELSFRPRSNFQNHEDLPAQTWEPVGVSGGGRSWGFLLQAAAVVKSCLRRLQLEALFLWTLSFNLDVLCGALGPLSQLKDGNKQHRDVYPTVLTAEHL